MAENGGGRKPLMSGNWKMNHNHLEAIQVVQKLATRLDDRVLDAVDVSVHPPFTGLRSIQTLIEADKLRLALGAQNCHWEDSGAYTGEVSPPMLAKLSVTYVVVGHSERRQHFDETDEMVNKKVRAVLATGMTPIMCVGETMEERETGDAQDKVQGQVRAGLEGVSDEQVGAMVIAYEPVWAIGTGQTATADDAQEMCEAIRVLVAETNGDDAAEALRIQYGGSVKPDNTAELMDQPDIDGALVGGGSLDPDDFSKIVRCHAPSG
ncbi:MAG TPA: triose-phosphate isomerase [Acidimicrobiales bacterium]|nr:triose-phosphate isomerase [Acidimicrobiales bacterium]